jgi:hypothetical protein
MQARTTVATANVLYHLDDVDARKALGDVLALQPDLVGLQEWYPSRLSVLRETGRVGPVPWRGVRPAQRANQGAGDYVWQLPLLGGCVVGARADRYGLLHCRSVLLSGPGHADREDRFLGLEPPRLATVGVYRDRQAGGTVALVDYHLVSGVQARGRYREDRPRLVDRHRHEVRRLELLVARLLAAGHVVHAVGDSNFDGFRVPGLTSTWEGREDAPGTLGPRRKVDDVHGPGPAELVTSVTTPSDHRALVVRRTVLSQRRLEQ